MDGCLYEAWRKHEQDVKDLEAMVATDYETDEMQSRLFVAPSTEALSRELHGFLGS